jgi:hypothetical protein
MMPSGQEQQGHTGRYCRDQNFRPLGCNPWLSKAGSWITIKEGSAPVKTTGGAMLQHWIFLDFAAVVFHGVLRTREICKKAHLDGAYYYEPFKPQGLTENFMKPRGLLPPRADHQ